MHVNGNTIKILLAGARYTGKGQIGRAWGQTDADLPTLQPVILYDRKVNRDGVEYRVVAWVLSYDPEFEKLRRYFFPDADGVIFTCNLAHDARETLKALDFFSAELKAVIGYLPPVVVMGIQLDKDHLLNLATVDAVTSWAAEKGWPVFQADFTATQEFSLVVDRAFNALLPGILAKIDSGMAKKRDNNYKDMTRGASVLTRRP
jgi:hypothetical protein